MNVSPLFKRTLIAGCLALVAVSPAAFAEVRLMGSGASFPAPIYAKWFKDFSSATKGARVDYQSKGSGAGIQDFINQIVDFAGSDAAMNDEQIGQVKNGVVLLPVTAGEIVLTYNLPGVSELRLPREVYPAIFTGEITKWNDPRIAAANPGVDLPDRDITVVVRSDSSGTTYVFTGHLAAIDEAFNSEIGQGTSPQWPQSAKFVKAPKNDGVTATVKQTPGAIGYVEFGFAKLTGAPVALLENRDGEFVAPGPETGSAALASAEFPGGNLPGSEVPDLRAWVFDPAGAQAYPIATFTWLLFPETQDPAKAAVARDLVEYILTEGQKSADELGYVPLPDNVIDKVREVAQLIR
ncbi:phosphate ABC transporter substrate-binding protein PstS [Thioalkalicoccus limnaeus]|uniref:Phosphate-binding protein PstS n=1 Tax=Thioalkalicoccus limnaeus TaxID=120681 RepID=A0ABV4BC12_9GAMM